MKACLVCGEIFQDETALVEHTNLRHPDEKQKKKNSLPVKFGVILIIYGILQMPVYIFVIKLSYDHPTWFQALESTSVHPGLVFYALGLLMVSVVVMIGGIALLLSRDGQIPDDL
jgi:hypothetical protein